MHAHTLVRARSNMRARVHARTQGLWSVAFGWDMVNELDLGRKRCREGAAVVYGLPHCAGLCHPEKEMPALHANSSCNLDS